MRKCAICMGEIPAKRNHRAKTCGEECSKELKRQWLYNKPQEYRDARAAKVKVDWAKYYADPIKRARILDNCAERYRTMPAAKKKRYKDRAKARAKAAYIPVKDRV